MPKSEYLQKVEAVRAHIAKGDLYEMNLCQEFFAENAAINPLQLFEALNQMAKTPFTAFYKIKNNYALCASPERFMQKRGQSLLVQPIKGTIKRGKTADEDAELRETLFNSPKDRSENVMIVDLMRNDLGRIAEVGSVEVKELFGIYPYANVFQMISTITATLRKDIHFAEALSACYPMGSMTGAPKIRAMQLIEQYENTKRGLYSGSIGYITPNGDFDFNVVIRSILYNSDNQYLSFQVGGAIVYDSVPEQEYEECLLKASLIFKVLEQNIGLKRSL
jgi:para-aminobenzoate synthetase component 1